jgi:hypothetical protein
MIIAATLTPWFLPVTPWFLPGMGYSPRCSCDLAFELKPLVIFQKRNLNPLIRNFQNYFMYVVQLNFDGFLYLFFKLKALNAPKKAERKISMFMIVVFLPF